MSYFWRGRSSTKTEPAGQSIGPRKASSLDGISRGRGGDEVVGLDLLLSFSKAEGLPINMIEAGWAGTPVMSTDVGGVKDLMPDENYGIIVSPAETPEESARRMQKLLSSEGRLQIREQGKRFQERVIAEFTQEKWKQRLTQIYAELSVNVHEKMKEKAICP